MKFKVHRTKLHVQAFLFCFLCSFFPSYIIESVIRYILFHSPPERGFVSALGRPSSAHLMGTSNGHERSTHVLSVVGNCRVVWYKMQRIFMQIFCNQTMSAPKSLAALLHCGNPGKVAIYVCVCVWYIRSFSFVTTLSPFVASKNIAAFFSFLWSYFQHLLCGRAF